MPSIALNKLFSDSRNANVCPPEILKKLSRNIQRTGYCPPLVVRPHPQKPGNYMIIDGHHRKRVLFSLGWTEAECQIWECSDEEAQIALVTLNQLRGEDNPLKRAKLFSSLTQTFPVEALSEMIPETPAQIEDYLALLRFDYDKLQENIQQQTQREIEAAPVPFTFMVPQEKAAIIEGILDAFVKKGSKTRSEAFIVMCESLYGELGHGKA
jgi:ParB/RepB/Spo0J family partition protein